MQSHCDVQMFLKFAIFYKCFIVEFNCIAVELIDFLKNDKKKFIKIIEFILSTCVTFETLKNVFIQTIIL